MRRTSELYHKITRGGISPKKSTVGDDANLGRGYQIGHSYFVPTKGQQPSKSWLDHILEYDIKPLVEEYYCDDAISRGTAFEILFGAC